MRSLMNNDYPDYVMALADWRRLPTNLEAAEFLNALLQEQQPVEEFFKRYPKRCVAHVVYALAIDGEIAYIGRTYTPWDRIMVHYKGGDASRLETQAMTSVGAVEVPPEHLELIEARIIRRVKPRMNVKSVSMKTTWGSRQLDDLAEVLTVQPSTIIDACRKNGVEIRPGNPGYGVDLFHALRSLADHKPNIFSH